MESTQTVAKFSLDLAWLKACSTAPPQNNNIQRQISCHSICKACLWINMIFSQHIRHSDSAYIIHYHHINQVSIIEISKYTIYCLFLGTLYFLFCCLILFVMCDSVFDSNIALTPTFRGVHSRGIQLATFLCLSQKSISQSQHRFKGETAKSGADGKRMFDTIIIIPCGTEIIYLREITRAKRKKLQISQTILAARSKLAETNDDWAVRAFQIFSLGSNLRSDNSRTFSPSVPTLLLVLEGRR